MKKNPDISALSVDPHVLAMATLVEAALTSTRPMNLQGSGTSLVLIWHSLRAEVHDLVCTKSIKYKKERALFETTAKPAIALLAAHLTQHFGVEASTAASLASLSLLLPFRMVAGAWCRAYKGPGDAIKVDVKELQRLRQNAKKLTD